jgi:ketosteroid isomerase-like protein
MNALPTIDRRCARVALAAMLSACIARSPAASTPSHIERGANSVARGDIQAAYDTLAGATMRGDVETAAAVYESDAINVRRNAPDLVGGASIKGSIAGWIASEEILALEYHVMDIEARGDIAAVRGTWTVRSRARRTLNAPAVTGRGKLVNLWKRDADDRWRLYWDIGVSAP